MRNQEIAAPYSSALKTIEGIFDGENCWGNDSKIYNVPPNYASKSKLVEGDRLTLYIQPNGKFIFKQALPVPRKSLMGRITFDNKVYCEGKTYRILPASLTFYKAKPGDDAVIIIPLDGSPTWAALENIIKEGKNQGDVEL